MNKRFYIIAATVLLFGLSLAFVVESYAGDQKEISVDQQDDPWKLLQPLVGSWTGTGHGTPGTSRIERQYEFVLGGKFLHVRNKSVFESSTANPKGEVHEDGACIATIGDVKHLYYVNFTTKAMSISIY